jgi:molybdopterin synthase sulfur carrier subunit
MTAQPQAAQAVTVRYFGGARAAAGISEEITAASTLAELRAILEATHGERLQRVLTACSFLVDGIAARRPEETALVAGSTVDVLPPFAGG